MWSSAAVKIFIAHLALTFSFGSTLRLYGAPYEGVLHRYTRPTFSKSDLRATGRIVGGEVAAEASAPWQVSLQNIYGSHFCGGAIISDQFVVTAASCVSGLQRNLVKVITSTNEWMGLAWQYDVEKIHVHCNFDKPLYSNDIALLKLATSIEYDDQTKNITVADEDELEEGETLTMTGWGSSVEGEWYEDELKELKVQYLPYEKCRAAYGNSDDVDMGHLCTNSSVGEGACHGDTGGPLVDSQGRLVGIGNWGVPCGRGFPDVFARISYHADWIRTTINGCNPT
ncbi:PREDICTED: chymotrypsin-2-like [Rhagoletis zephyria]|uniref:chymotrypsin-2-like n=1 Tax=Rhagoletis zephyria TaxID=28612 RepID=UPI0008119BAD|nr:PREDICTED: chymotrypsin-2-like [Rhagoletis zephyria]